MTRVYTAGPDGRCTVCQRPEAEHAPEAWSETSRACPPAELAAQRCETEVTHPWSLETVAIRRGLATSERGLAVQVTAETVTDEQIDRYHNTIMMSDASSATADHVAMTCGLAKNSDIPSRVRMKARMEVAAAINARAKGGR